MTANLMPQYWEISDGFVLLVRICAALALVSVLVGSLAVVATCVLWVRPLMVSRRAWTGYWLESLLAAVGIVGLYCLTVDGGGLIPTWLQGAALSPGLGAAMAAARRRYRHRQRERLHELERSIE